MRKLKYIFIALSLIILSVGCAKINSKDPYKGNLNQFIVQAIYPKGFDKNIRAKVVVNIENTLTGTKYQALTDEKGKAITELPNGIYRISINDKMGNHIFNGTADKVKISGKDVDLEMNLTHSKTGSLVIKELYTGGCNKFPQEGTYQSDKYVIIHNNDNEVYYLDNLCLGTLSPYNSNSNNPWISRDEKGATVYPEFIPIIQVIWEIGGNGKSFPLQPGEDAVICLNGGIDHSKQYPNSINLNNENYFVCYNTNYFPNTIYHPAPGDKIKNDHILDVVIKMGKATAFSISLASPTLVLFKSKKGTIQDFVNSSGNLLQVPGSMIDKVVTIPLDWIIDGIEVFDGRSTSNSKRLHPSIDAGFATLTDIFKGKSLFRKTDEEATKESGFEVLQDTNNSTNDFYERKQQSLHK